MKSVLKHLQAMAQKIVLTPLQYWSPLAFHIRTLYLFTCNDFLSTLLMPSIFTLLSALAAPALGLEIPKSYSELLYRLLLAPLWLWGTLLVFNIHNQRHPAAILADSKNKPWRPLPSKRLTPKQTKNLLLAVYPTMILFTIRFGGIQSFLWEALWCFWYNEWGGSQSLIIRNYLNAAGLGCFLSGPLEVVIYGQSGLLESPKALWWLLTIGTIVFTTIQVQDFRDKDGDILEGRRTLPLVLKDTFARWITVTSIAFWSFVVPAIWKSSLLGFSLPLSFGSFMVFSLMFDRTVKGDIRSWNIWSLWLASFFVLPLLGT